MKIKVLKHEKNEKGYFYKHQALVEITGEFDIKEQKGEIIQQVSEKVGYSDTYGGKIKKLATGGFVITWETGC
jgi:hypothetical protein